jgi:hypothetical protein
MPELWNNEIEKRFFRKYLDENLASPEQLFYLLEDSYYAYIPKRISSEGQTLQSRNTLIGNYTENWCKNLLNPIANELNLFAVNNVICNEISLSNMSSADVAFCTTNDRNQKADNIKIIFEVKMSIVSNYKYCLEGNEITLLGDYKSHKGQPSLLRSDSMLKAIGKSIDIRVYGYKATKIPIIILGNTPISNGYTKKVDYLKKNGVIQAFISLNPQPTDSEDVRNSEQGGFFTVNNYEELTNYLRNLTTEEMNFFASMIPKNELGQIIQTASLEETLIQKAEKFLSLIRE